jgi:hypothetical protein
MGKRKFHQQIMEDDRLFQESKIADQIDIVTMQDYLQVRNLNLDVEKQTKKAS